MHPVSRAPETSRLASSAETTALRRLVRRDPTAAPDPKDNGSASAAPPRPSPAPAPCFPLTGLLASCTVGAQSLSQWAPGRQLPPCQGGSVCVSVSPIQGLLVPEASAPFLWGCCSAGLGWSGEDLTAPVGLAPCRPLAPEPSEGDWGCWVPCSPPVASALTVALRCAPVSFPTCPQLQPGW